MKQTAPVIFALGILFALAAAAVYLSASPREDTSVPPAPHTETDGAENGKPDVCAQVITPARNAATGEIREFPTPCDVPDGWETILNEEPGLDFDIELQ